jgi:hypothetical protein
MTSFYNIVIIIIYTIICEYFSRMLVILIIVGQVGGNEYRNKGGGTNYLCLPNDPDNGKPYSYANDVLYGAEYQTGSSAKPSGMNIYCNCFVLDIRERFHKLIV